MPPKASAPGPALAFRDHDHGACRGAALARAEALVAERGLRLTPVRRRALEILLESHQALGAYELLDRLGAEGFGRQPPVAYREIGQYVGKGRGADMTGATLAEEELAELEEAFLTGAPERLRRLVQTYHRRRSRAAAGIVRALYRADA